MDFELLPIYFENFKKYMDKSISNVIKQYGITFIQFRPIVLLNRHKEDGLSLQELTEKIGIDKANVTRVINDLLEKDIVYKSDLKQRGYKIKLTKKGLEIANKIINEKEKMHEKLFMCFSEEEKEQFFSLLIKMYESIPNGEENNEKDI